MRSGRSPQSTPPARETARRPSRSGRAARSSFARTEPRRAAARAASSDNRPPVAQKVRPDDESKVLRKYLEDIARYPILTAERERELGHIIQSPDTTEEAKK